MIVLSHHQIDGRLVPCRPVDEVRREVLGEVREAVRRGMYVNDGDDPKPLEAALASVKWNGSPHLGELQHAIGTFVSAALATLTEEDGGQPLPHRPTIRTKGGRS